MYWVFGGIAIILLFLENKEGSKEKEVNGEVERVKGEVDREVVRVKGEVDREVVMEKIAKKEILKSKKALRVKKIILEKNVEIERLQKELDKKVENDINKNKKVDKKIEDDINKENKGIVPINKEKVKIC